MIIRSSSAFSSVALYRRCPANLILGMCASSRKSLFLLPFFLFLFFSQTCHQIWLVCNTVVWDMIFGAVISSILHTWYSYFMIELSYGGEKNTSPNVSCVCVCVWLTKCSFYFSHSSIQVYIYICTAPCVFNMILCVKFPFFFSAASWISIAFHHLHVCCFNFLFFSFSILWIYLLSRTQYSENAYAVYIWRTHTVCSHQCDQFHLNRFSNIIEKGAKNFCILICIVICFEERKL